MNLLSPPRVCNCTYWLTLISYERHIDVEMDLGVVGQGILYSENLAPTSNSSSGDSESWVSGQPGFHFGGSRSEGMIVQTAFGQRSKNKVVRPALSKSR